MVSNSRTNNGNRSYTLDPGNDLPATPSITITPNKMTRMKIQGLILQFLVVGLLAQSSSMNFAQTSERPAAQDRSDERKDWVEYLPDPYRSNAKHIVLISGDEEYRSEEALPMLGQILTRHHGFKCTVLFAIDPETGEIDPNNQQNIPNMKVLATADLVIMALRFRNLPDEDMAYLDNYLKAGKPIIGLRTSTHAFRMGETSKYKHYSFNSKEWPGGFGQQVLGDTWINHHGGHKTQSTRGIVNEANAKHPVLNFVDDVWGNTDVYGQDLHKHLNDLPHKIEVTSVRTGLSICQTPTAPTQNILS